MSKDTWKNAISWATAFFCSFVLINFILFCYSKDVAGYNRDGGVFFLLNEPGDYIVNCLEGAGIQKVDKNGYLNASADLSTDGYVLIIGNSMTDATQVNYNSKYTGVLNSLLQEKYNDDKVKAYCMAKGGASFSEAASGYSAANKEFPDAKATIIQVLNGTLDGDDLKMVYQQREYDGSQTIDAIKRNEGIAKKIKHWIKGNVPIVAFLLHERKINVNDILKDAFIYNNGYKVVEDVNTTYNGPFSELEKNDDYRSSGTYIDLVEALEYLNNLSGEPIIILYLPSEQIEVNGKLKVQNDDSAMIEAACIETGVIFVDMTADWEDLYTTEKKLAYGYSNTRPAYGHMNRTGHRIVAERLYKVLIEQGVFE